MNKLLTRTFACMLCLLLALTGAAHAEDYEDHILTGWMNSGTCTTLTGDMELTVIFVDLPGEPWEANARKTLKKYIAAASDKLQEEAAAYGAELSITRKYYNVSAERTTDINDETEWAAEILDSVNFLAPSSNDDGSPSAYVGRPILFCINGGGRAFAWSKGSDSDAEYLVLFDDTDAGTVRHEMLHLFGARDFYLEPQIMSAAKQYFPDSIMMSSDKANKTDSLTAYLIGWCSEPDAAAKKMLDATAHITQEDIDAARETDRLTGYGTKTGDDYVYTGMMEDGFRHGWGIITWDDGDVYEGDWVWGVRTGKGTMTWANGDVYTGDFVDGERTGKGTYTWADGDVYTGDFIESERTGKGTYTWADGDVYTGDFVDGKRTGKGTMTWADGDVYTGDFVDGKCTGKGVYLWANGNTYYGDFVNGEFEGKGTLIWADGDVYTGDYVNGARTGKGTYAWADGATYSGDFKDNERHGEGIYCSETGKVTKGKWKNGEYVKKK